jgi:hypothetical protein
LCKLEPETVVELTGMYDAVDRPLLPEVLISSVLEFEFVVLTCLGPTHDPSKASTRL